MSYDPADENPPYEPELLGYHCGVCGRTTWTIQLVAGITMERIQCLATPRCEGIAGYNHEMTTSEFGAKPSHEWYRMRRADARRLERRMPGGWQYHKNGGLGLRKVTNG